MRARGAGTCPLCRLVRHTCAKHTHTTHILCFLALPIKNPGWQFHHDIGWWFLVSPRMGHMTTKLPGYMPDMSKLVTTMNLNLATLSCIFEKLGWGWVVPNWFGWFWNFVMLICFTLFVWFICLFDLIWLIGIDWPLWQLQVDPGCMTIDSVRLSSLIQRKQFLAARWASKFGEMKPNFLTWTCFSNEVNQHATIWVSFYKLWINIHVAR